LLFLRLQLLLLLMLLLKLPLDHLGWLAGVAFELLNPQIQSSEEPRKLCARCSHRLPTWWST